MLNCCITGQPQQASHPARPPHQPKALPQSCRPPQPQHAPGRHQTRKRAPCKQQMATSAATAATASLKATLGDLQQARREQQGHLTQLTAVAQDRGIVLSQLHGQIQKLAEEHDSLEQQRQFLAVDIQSANAVSRQAKNSGEPRCPDVAIPCQAVRGCPDAHALPSVRPPAPAQSKRARLRLTVSAKRTRTTS